MLKLKFINAKRTVLLYSNQSLVTVADKLKEEKEAKEQKLAEIQAKEKRLQDRLKQQDKKELGFKAFLINFKNKIVSYWHALKKKFAIDS